jgi:hypothetical protein
MSSLVCVCARAHTRTSMWFSVCTRTSVWLSVLACAVSAFCLWYVCLCNSMMSVCEMYACVKCMYAPLGVCVCVCVCVYVCVCATCEWAYGGVLLDFKRRCLGTLHFAPAHPTFQCVCLHLTIRFFPG